MICSRFIHVAANSSISLCFYAELYSIVCVYILYVCVCVYHIFFIHSSVNGNLGCFHVLIIVNSAAMNTRVNVSFLLLLYFLYFFLAMPRGMQNLNSLTTDQTFAPCSGSKESQLLGTPHYCSVLWLNGKEPTCQAGDTGSIPGLGIYPGEENGNPLQ